jgi:hypothetical protein
MPTPCETINTKQVLNLIRETISDKARLNCEVKQDGSLSNCGPALTHRVPKGAAMIYAPGPGAIPSMAPDASDIRRLVNEDRPFVCKAMRIAGVNNAKCHFGVADLIKRELSRVDESEKEFEKLWPTQASQKVKLTTQEYEQTRHRKLPPEAKSVTIYEPTRDKEYKDILSSYKRDLNEVMSDFPELFVETCRVRL